MHLEEGGELQAKAIPPHFKLKLQKENFIVIMMLNISHGLPLS